MTDFTRTVGTTGRQHSSLTAAFADIGVGFGNTDLVTNEDTIRFECYDDTVFDESVTFSGLTTDDTYDVTVIPATGEGGDGVLGAGVRWRKTTSGTIFTALDSFHRFIGLEIQLQSAGASSNEAIRIGDGSHTAEGTLIDKCLLDAADGGNQQDGIYTGNYDVGSSGAHVIIRDTVITGWERACIHLQMYDSGGTDTAYVDIVNCTITSSRPSAAGDGEYGIGYRIRASGAALNLQLINTLIGDNATADFAETASSAGTLTTTGSATNFDELDEVPAGGTPNPIVWTDDPAPAAGDWAIFESLHDNLALLNDADNDVLDQGTGPASESLVSTTDIAGNARAGTTCDPGCHQVTAVAAGVDPGAFLDRFEHMPAPNTSLRM